MSDICPIHTVPVWKDEPEHEDKETCWCRPVVNQICPCCEADPVANCWQCLGSGTVPHRGGDEIKLVVHNALTLEPVEARE